MQCTQLQQKLEMQAMKGRRCDKRMRAALLQPLRRQHPLPNLVAPRLQTAQTAAAQTLLPVSCCAHRCMARPGDKVYCRLSINTQLLSNLEDDNEGWQEQLQASSKGGKQCVVRIDLEPMNPPPPINFKQWDGLTRIAFLRKNKTLSALFKQSSVLATLTKNYVAYCSHNNIEMAKDLDMKQKIDDILKGSGFAEKRARTMDIDDFMQLLLVFNKEGVFFG